MEAVEALNAPVADSGAGVIVTTDTPAQVSETDALRETFRRVTGSDEGPSRGADGRFVSSASGEAAGAESIATEPLEGGEGGEPVAAETSTPAVKVPLPANWTGLDEHWASIPPAAQEAIAANQTKLHKTLSDQGRVIAAYKPISDVFGEFKEYFDGTVGNYKGDEAVRYLFGLQRAMDANPLDTLMQIADSYELRGQLAQMFGTPAEGTAQQTDHTQALLAEIGQLKKTIAGLADPSKIDERITTRLNEDRATTAVNDVISRTATKEAMPLYGDVEEALPDFIRMSWRKLGDTASQEAVLKHAYDMAVNADPDLRKKAAALTSAASPEAAKIEAARKANATNIRSTTTGKSREPTEDELLKAAYRNAQRA